MFPLFDIWRLAVPEPAIPQAMPTPLVEALVSTSELVSSSPRATLITLLRLINALATSSLSQSLLLLAEAQEAGAAPRAASIVVGVQRRGPKTKVGSVSDLNLSAPMIVTVVTGRARNV